MRGSRRQHRRQQTGKIRTMLACLDGGKRLCGEVDANIGARCPPLFAPRYPLCLRFGEQNLHISAAGFELLGRPAAASLCSPLPAIPCAFVSGSKIFTFPPPNLSFPGTRRPLLFAPPSSLTLVASFRGAKSSHFSRRFSPSPAPGGRRI